MGMFDWVITTHKLPSVQKANRLAFQTKSLERNLDIVYIDEGGAAWRYTWASDYKDREPMYDTEFVFYTYIGHEASLLEFKVAVKDGHCQHLKMSKDSTFNRPYVEGSVLHNGERTRRELFETIGVPR